MKSHVNALIVAVVLTVLVVVMLLFDAEGFCSGGFLLVPAAVVAWMVFDTEVKEAIRQSLK